MVAKFKHGRNVYLASDYDDELVIKKEGYRYDSRSGFEVRSVRKVANPGAALRVAARVALLVARQEVRRDAVPEDFTRSGHVVPVVELF